MAALLDWWETTKKDKNDKHCNNQRKQFSPFVISMEGMLRREVLDVLAKLSRLIAAKRDKPLLQVLLDILIRIPFLVYRKIPSRKYQTIFLG